MKERVNNQKNKEIKINKILKVVVAIGLITLIIAVFFPGKLIVLYKESGRYSMEILMIFPAILLIMGLVDVWIPNSMIEKYLGSNQE